MAQYQKAMHGGWWFLSVGPSVVSCKVEVLNGPVSPLGVCNLSNCGWGLSYPLFSGGHSFYGWSGWKSGWFTKGVWVSPARRWVVGFLNVRNWPGWEAGVLWGTPGVSSPQPGPLSPAWGSQGAPHTTDGFITKSWHRPLRFSDSFRW